MSSRRNFLDADNSIMEKNLRFVKNDLEDNLNQYFGGSGNRGNNSTNITAPPRDYKIIQPKPGGSHYLSPSNGVENRKEFLLQLGLARHEAYELAKSYNFNVNFYEKKCQEFFNKGYRLYEVLNKILSDIRNENLSSNVEDEIPLRPRPVSHISTFLEEDDPTRGGFHENRFQRDRSRSRSRPRDHREECYQTTRLRSPNRSFSSPHDRNELSRSPPRIHCNDEHYFSSRSRSPNRAIKTIEICNNERYLQNKHFRDDMRRDVSSERPYYPSGSRRSEEYYQAPRSRSPNSYFRKRKGEEYCSQYDNHRNDVRRDTFSEQTRTRQYSPARNDRNDDSQQISREVSCQLPRLFSPNRVSNSMQIRDERYELQRDDYRDDLVRNVGRERSRSYSPSRHDRRAEHYQSSRMLSPIRGNFSEHDNYEEIIRERSRSIPYSPSRNDYREGFYPISASHTPNRDFDLVTEERHDDFSSQHMNTRDFGISSPKSYGSHGIYNNNNRFDNPQQCLKGKESIPINRKTASNNHQNHSSSQNSNIPSLLSLNLLPYQIDDQQPTTSREANRCIPESNKKQSAQHFKKQTQFNNKKKSQDTNKVTMTNMDLKRHFAIVPVIQCGLAKPPSGHLKANPQEYWSKWWPRYKYVEYSLPQIDVNENEIKNCINSVLKCKKFGNSQLKPFLLDIGVDAIMQTVDMNETNYYVRDIFRLFVYKKHLEDPNFQNSLKPEELNLIAPALRQFRIKSIMAFLHQAIITRWHISLDIMKKVKAGQLFKSTYARVLLNEKCFHYLVKESIQELKKMCQQDWPQFNEFYKNIKATKVNIYAIGVGPNMKS